MSRSRKKPIIKDAPRNYKKSTLYWRRIRSVVNQKVRGFINGQREDDTLPIPKEIVNDYDYCDYKIDYRKGWAKNDKNKERAKRK